ncbi:MAG: hypothetical protein QOK35_1526 [Pseudonocardiales bacterium]|nr:hypothetical protein [Pseudonocardiales bacterium]
MSRALLAIAREPGDERALARSACQACVAGADVDGAAMSVLTASAFDETLSATDPTAATLEELQFTLGEGACIDAASSGRPVLVPDVHDHVLTRRWPVFAAAVAEQTDVRALFALPMQLGSINLGVIDLYRTSPGPLRGHELRDIVAATDSIARLLLAAQLRTDDDDGGPGRDDPADDRAEVHQATGMVLAQLDIPAPDALVRLRAYAFAHDRPLIAVARDVVARRLVFTEDME